MIRTLAAVCALLVAAAAAPAADAKKVTLRWHGQSFFEIISTKGTRIVLDPHAIEAFGRNQVEADLVLMTHKHTDHTQTGVITNLKSAKVFNGLKTVDKAEVWNVLDEKFKDVKFHTVGTYHDAMAGMKRGKNSAFVIEVDGLRIVHLGDLGHLLSETQIKKIGPVDVLLIPVGGIYTINGLDAQKVVEQLKPRRYVIPMHYGIRFDDPLLTLPKSTFLDDVEPERIKRFPTTNTLLIDPTEKAPKEPFFAILNWETKK